MVAKPLNMQSGMPQMSAAFAGWKNKITIIKRTQTVVDSLVQYNDFPITFMGTIQPLTAQQISLKPEGQRSWEWLQIHCEGSNLTLTTDDQIKYKTILYKVMGVWAYDLNNYREFHVVKDYQS